MIVDGWIISFFIYYLFIFKICIIAICTCQIKCDLLWFPSMNESGDDSFFLHHKDSIIWWHSAGSTHLHHYCIVAFLHNLWFDFLNFPNQKSFCKCCHWNSPLTDMFCLPSLLACWITRFLCVSPLQEVTEVDPRDVPHTSSHSSSPTQHQMGSVVVFSKAC